MAKGIRNMPMGMNTAVGEDVGFLSGGQAQWAPIAAALVRKLKLLRLDEATNFLDNAPQASVVRQGSFEELAAVPDKFRDLVARQTA